MVPKLWFETGTQILRSHHCDTMGQAALEGKKLSTFMESLGINTEAHNGGGHFVKLLFNVFGVKHDGMQKRFSIMHS